MYTILLFILIGVTLTLRGNAISTDGSGRVVITDINPNGDNDEDALICRSEMPGIDGNWFLHPIQQTMDESDRIESTDSRGWSRDRATTTIGITGFGRLVRLRRDDSVASGGRALYRRSVHVSYSRRQLYSCLCGHLLPQ